MTWYEILIIIAACAIVLGVIVTSIVRRKQGKTGCGCDCGGCAGCSGCAACASHKKPGDKPDEPNKPTRQSP